MKVVLISVPYNITRVAPISLSLLAGELKAHGYDVKCIDFNIDAYSKVDESLKGYWKYRQGHLWNESDHFESILYPRVVEKHADDWCNRILSEKPDVLGISITQTQVGDFLAKRIKESNPEILTVIGGPSCSRVHGDFATTPSDYIDACVSGEGEGTLVDLLDKYKQTGELCAVPGATIKKGDEIIYGDERPIIQDLDKLAFSDFSDFDLSLYKDADDAPNKDTHELKLPMYTSRGCVADCSFCVDYRMWGSKYREKSVDRVISEMKFYIKKYGIRKFDMVQPLLNGSHMWLREFAEKCIKEELNITYHSFARLDKRMSTNLLTLLKKSGLISLNYGLESASNNVLKKMKKGYNKKTASECIKNTYKAGIPQTVNLITGFPGETIINWLETVYFIFRHRKYLLRAPNLAACGIITGSDLHINHDKYGIVVNKEEQRDENWHTVDKKNTYEKRMFRYKTTARFFSKLNFGH